MTTEEWRPIEGFPGYQVSNLSRVEGPRKLLTPQLDKDGYYKVHLIIRNKHHRRGVHILVCTAFNGPKPSPEMQCLHRDDVRLHNTPDNLYWGTHQDNMDDRTSNGRTASGENHYDAKLNWEKVREIRRRVKAGEKPYRLQSEYKISNGTITSVVYNRSWKDPNYVR